MAMLHMSSHWHSTSRVNNAAYAVQASYLANAYVCNVCVGMEYQVTHVHVQLVIMYVMHLHVYMYMCMHMCSY